MPDHRRNDSSNDIYRKFVFYTYTSVMAKLDK